MPSVKLTVFIEDHADLDMEVHVVAPETLPAVSVTPIPVSRPRPQPVSRDDEYQLGGYAGI